MPPETFSNYSEEPGLNDGLAEKLCYHCGLPVPVGTVISVKIAEQPQPMCCYGCQAVCQAIINAGLSDYYLDRDTPARSRRNVVPAALRDLQTFDNPQIQKSFVQVRNDDLMETALILDGITCAACVWLNENFLGKIKGIRSVDINYSTHRARITWDDSLVKLSAILEAISSIGYRAFPYDPKTHETILESNRKALLKRIGVAALFGMQVMILAVAMYSGQIFGMDTEIHTSFRWISLGLVIPIISYAAGPFFTSAVRDIRNLRIGMDVSVALGIGIAFIASAYSTFTGHGNIYFESIAMFVFFLLSAKYFELGARKTSTFLLESATSQVPVMATLIDERQVETTVPVSDVSTGDVLLVRPGETIPVDGRIIEGQTGIDESLVTGESRSVLRNTGDFIMGGSLNCEQPFKMRVTHVGHKSTLATLVRLVEKAQAEKPALSQLADRVASWFILAILLIAVCAGFYWWLIMPKLAIPVVISVLIVACPCALSLATPTAFTAAIGFLTSRGILLTRGNKFQLLARATHCIFDKTGTITTGKLMLKKVVLHGEMTEPAVLTLASSLESGSSHPVARALEKNHLHGDPLPEVTDLCHYPGLGVSGIVENRTWYFGSANFLTQVQEINVEKSSPASSNQIATIVYLASDNKLIAEFHLVDEIRDDSSGLVKKLLHSGIKTTLLTGDSRTPAEYVARKVGITNVLSAMSPEEKLNYVIARKKKGEVIVMVGDGLNDAPVLAGADISFALGDGVALAALSADIVLVTNKISGVWTTLQTAKKTMSVLKQNIAWAVAYNIVAVSLATTSVITPWMAAIGMSVSSVLVVLNSLRLKNTVIQDE